MIRQLARSIREYRKDSIWTPILVSLEVVMEVIMPFLMAYLIDYGISRGAMSVVVRTGLALFAAALVSLVFGVLAGQRAAVASAGFAKNLRQDMFYHVQGFAFSNIDKFSTSSIITRLTTDVNNVQMAFQMIIRLAARSPVMLLFSLAAAFSVNPRLSLIFLAIVPVLGIGLFAIVKIVFPIFGKIFSNYDQLNNVVQENLRGMRVVKSYNREAHENSKFSAISQRIHDGFCRAEKIIAFNMPLMQFTMYACLLLISWFGARLIVTSGNNPAAGLSTGQLMSLIMYSMQILMSLMALSMVFVMITISRASAGRIVELLGEESALQNSTHPVSHVPDGSICFEDVSFSYSPDAEQPCLQSVSLNIAAGETVGIIGSSGSAKSSLVQLIPRLYDVSAGRILVGGIDVRDYDLKVLRDQVAVVLQKNTLFSGTIRDNLRWGNEEASDEAISAACHQAQADGFIRQFPDQYDTLIAQDGTNVSGGQKQRLCIARALLKQPRILILDDSTSAVDTRTDAQIRKMLRETMPEATKIIIAQRISSVQDADKIVVMDEGRITAVGPHDQLLATSRIYQEVYASQVKGGYIHA